MLETAGVSRAFGKFVAVDDVSMRVDAAAIYGVIGPNGAGKTTLFDVLSGFLAPTRGKIMFAATDVSRATVHRRVSAGIVRTFQTPRLFDEMTVAENLALAGDSHERTILGQLIPRPSVRRRVRLRVAETLELVGLEKAADTQAGDLPYALRRLAEVGRALMLEPKLLMLDEPAAGMNTFETREFAGLVRRLQQTGLTILLIEHDMDFVLNLCDECMVLNLGRTIAAGSPGEIRKNPDVIAAYLGGSV